MKKTIILIMCISIFYLFISDSVVESLEIPNDAIRIRVIPNSNSEYDQMIKGKVKDKLQITMYKLLKEAENSEEAEKIIKTNISNVDKELKKVLKKEEYNKEYAINFGYNYFPEKEYKGIKYNEGYYKSLLVTLGEGKGDNWWCVLFPPLCLIEAEENTEVEYKSFVKEIIDKYLK